jgi:DNA-binding MarR family transcriptional regulator
MSDTDVAAWSALLRVHAALVPVLDRELQATCNLPLTWYDVLLELNSAPGRRLSMGQLGEVAVVSRTRVSRVVDQLAGEGLVVRETNPDDRRSAYATITEAGRKRLRAAAPVYRAGIQRHFTSQMSAAESRSVATALEKVLSAVADYPRPSRHLIHRRSSDRL